MKKLKLGAWNFFLLFLGTWLIFKLFSGTAVDYKHLESSEIAAHLNSGKVAKVHFRLENLTIKWEESSKDGKAPVYYTSRVAGTEQWNEVYNLVKSKKIPFDSEWPPDMFWSSVLIQIFSTVLMVFLWVWLMQRMMGGGNGKGGPGGIFQFGKSEVKMYVRNKDRVTFNDVAGCEEAKSELKDIVDFLKNPAEHARLGAKISSGVLLVGEPGTGKTLLAKAVAGEAGVSFIYANGSEFMEMFVGVGASRVRNLFEAARKSLPCVLFIDEIDAVGHRRSSDPNFGHREAEQTLDALLAEMDGFDGNSKIVVIAATNRPDVLDPALTRPGRFDAQIHVPRPDKFGREQILKVHTRNKKIDPSVDLSSIAQETVGMVGADLENVVNEATKIATKKSKLAVAQEDFSEAIDKVSMGPARKSMKLSKTDLKVTAYHEAGHVIAALAWGADPVHKVTIVPRGQALGFTKQLPEDDVYLQRERELTARLGTLVGGRAAEELIFRQPSTGAHNDFEKATMLITKMVYEFGMLGGDLVVHKAQPNLLGFPAGFEISEKTKERLELLVKQSLDRIYQETKSKLSLNRAKLEALASALLEKETLNKDEIENIWQSA